MSARTSGISTAIPKMPINSYRRNPIGDMTVRLLMNTTHLVIV